MNPLDLRKAPPRGPRVEVCGMVFTARVIDKLRAAMPGGNLNGYFPDTGMSAAWAHYSGISLDDLREIVERAGSEAEIEAWIAQRTASLDKVRFNAKLQSLETARVSGAWREMFEAAYPPDLRAQHALLFDLIEADDARAFR